jgi:SAM-dependent methyltransferase
MAPNASIRKAAHWDVQYRANRLPWETGQPSTELKRVLRELSVRPGKAVELGCGTGTNAVWLAGQGWEVTAVDLSVQAIRKARRRAAEAGVRVQFLVGDLTDPLLLQGPFNFFFDRGCYHAVRQADAAGYHRTLKRITRPGTPGLVLMGNAEEPEEKTGPPVVSRQEIYEEWAGHFGILSLRPFRFDPRRPGERRYLGWSCLVRRRA